MVVGVIKATGSKIADAQGILRPVAVGYAEPDGSGLAGGYVDDLQPSRSQVSNTLKTGNAHSGCRNGVARSAVHIKGTKGSSADCEECKNRDDEPKTSSGTPTDFRSRISAAALHIHR